MGKKAASREVDVAPVTGLRFLCDDKRHLVCVPYSIGNLHRMARHLDLRPCWFHAGERAHYDIPKSRIAEVTAKCEVVSPREIVRIIREARE